MHLNKSLLAVAIVSTLASISSAKAQIKFQSFLGKYSLWDVFDSAGKGHGVAAIYYGNIVTMFDTDCRQDRATVTPSGRPELPGGLAATTWPGPGWRGHRTIASAAFILDRLGQNVTQINWNTGTVWRRDSNPGGRATCAQATPPP